MPNIDRTTTHNLHNQIERLLPISSRHRNSFSFFSAARDVQLRTKKSSRRRSVKVQNEKSMQGVGE
jgi:hypothetical protein